MTRRERLAFLCRMVLLVIAGFGLGFSAANQVSSRAMDKATSILDELVDQNKKLSKIAAHCQVISAASPAPVRLFGSSVHLRVNAAVSDEIEIHRGTAALFPEGQ